MSQLCHSQWIFFCPIMFLDKVIRYFSCIISPFLFLLLQYLKTILPKFFFSSKIPWTKVRICRKQHGSPLILLIAYSTSTLQIFLILASLTRILITMHSATMIGTSPIGLPKAVLIFLLSFLMTPPLVALLQSSIRKGSTFSLWLP